MKKASILLLLLVSILIYGCGTKEEPTINENNTEENTIEENIDDDQNDDGREDDRDDDWDGEGRDDDDEDEEETYEEISEETKLEKHREKIFERYSFDCGKLCINENVEVETVSYPDGEHKEYDGNLNIVGNVVNGKKDGVWIAYKDGLIKVKITYKNGIKDGEWEYNGGGTEMKGSYKNNKRDGKRTITYGGELTEEGTYVDGVKEGEWSYYSYDYDNSGYYDDHARTSVRQFGNYKNGVKDGVRKRVCKNVVHGYKGHEYTEGTYVNGVKEGEWYDFDKCNERSHGNYVNGIKNGKWVDINESTDERSEGNYVNGEKDGVRYEYWTQGGKKNLRTYSNGILEGNREDYSRRGEIISGGMMHEGKMDGMQRVFGGKNNEIIQEMEYKDGKYLGNGLFIQYDYKANQRIVSVYENFEEISRIIYDFKGNIVDEYHIDPDSDW